MANLTKVEDIKVKSKGLRGTLKESLGNQLTGALYEDDQQLIKFHGTYQQDDRDRRKIRAQKKLEKAYSFMTRLRIPGGRITAKQMAACFSISDEHADTRLKISTRQTLQVHSILKRKLKPMLSDFAKYDLDAIAACGDVNRNVVATYNLENIELHNHLVEFSRDLSLKLLPKSHAYADIWLDGEKITDNESEEDPLYKDIYLPRKFKIAIAVPPFNDVDVFANDIGLIAITENDKIIGFNVAAGGGMGATHGNEKTYPRVGSVLGYVAYEDVFSVIYEIMQFQRDHGDRTDRAHARIKYTIDEYGLEKFKKYVEDHSKVKFQEERPYKFEHRTDILGWYKNSIGNWNYGIFVEHGRIFDQDHYKISTALRDIAKLDISEFQFSTNQNVTILNVEEKHKAKIEKILKDTDVSKYQESISALRKNSIACTALNKCPLALAEGQRYLPSLISKIDPILEKYKLREREITIRMTGCPNGCARPYLAEIAFVGTAMGKYNLHLGADRLGTRLNKKYKESLNEEEILKELESLFKDYAANSNEGEDFGDYIIRKKIV